MTAAGPTAPVGVVLGTHLSPDQTARLAALAEELGFHELWLPEDYFFTGGISSAATALAATHRIPVGLGVVSAITRHPALLAMECSTLANAYGNRLWPGIGLGAPPALRRMGLKIEHPVEYLREYVRGVSRLLSGEEITESGRFTFGDVRLAYPSPSLPPVFMGAIRAKALQLSGEIADGTVLGSMSSAPFISWAVEQVRHGRVRAGRPVEGHRFPAFSFLCLRSDRAHARAALRPVLAPYLKIVGEAGWPYTEILGIGEEIRALRSVDRIAHEMPDAWIDEFAIAGDAEDCAHQINHLLDAGATSVALFPVPFEEAHSTLSLAADELLPRVRMSERHGDLSEEP
ncbi:LLM class flavin-dependent oxidoreductase [Streptomyces sp. OE57]|uniref:LLM class flavin-dependent oxidoreductase n=1 Tax=Streptomyces lacaronensis TaxID=3379885 RepID=UPI0039B75383